MGRSTSSRRIASLRPLFAAPAAPYFHLRWGLLFSCTRGARLPADEREAPVQGLAAERRACYRVTMTVTRTEPYRNAVPYRLGSCYVDDVFTNCFANRYA